MVVHPNIHTQTQTPSGCHRERSLCNSPTTQHYGAILDGTQVVRLDKHLYIHEDSESLLEANAIQDLMVAGQVPELGEMDVYSHCGHMD